MRFRQSQSKLKKRYKSRLTLNKSTEPCQKLVGAISKSPSASNQYNFVSTTSNPAYIIASVGKRKAEFTNLETWKFLKEKKPVGTQRENLNYRIKKIDKHVNEFLEKQMSKRRKIENDALIMASTHDGEGEPSNKFIINYL